MSSSSVELGACRDGGERAVRPLSGAWLVLWAPLVPVARLVLGLQRGRPAPTGEATKNMAVAHFLRAFLCARGLSERTPCTARGLWWFILNMPIPLAQLGPS